MEEILIAIGTGIAGLFAGSFISYKKCNSDNFDKSKKNSFLSFLFIGSNKQEIK